ncbi:hypothetical protein SAY86_014382 [Trapa natans]|uniref:PsbP C-terminal domain-containing protein n=1 Tax=Trapa natans TaxID=22666 RepID=A0AAN7QMZ6_TRANT|nr:hypothetical protein SAY86_014382 [Trapa natans]
MALRNCSSFSAHDSLLRTHPPIIFSSLRTHFSPPVPALNPQFPANGSLCLNRRDLGLSIVAVLLHGCLHKTALAQELELERYTDAMTGFTLLKPSSWIKVDKAGATVLFEEPGKGSNNIGVVVNPVRLSSLGDFGSPEFVADKLIQAEKRKVGAYCFLLHIWCVSKIISQRNLIGVIC